MKKFLLIFFTILGLLLAYFFGITASVFNGYSNYIYQGSFNLNVNTNYEIRTDFTYNKITVEDESMISTTIDEGNGDTICISLNEEEKNGKCISTLKSGSTLIYLHKKNVLGWGEQVFVYDVNIIFNPTLIENVIFKDVSDENVNTSVIPNKIDSNASFIGTVNNSKKVTLEYGHQYSLSFLKGYNPTNENDELKFVSVTSDGSENNVMHLSDDGILTVRGLTNGYINFYSNVLGGISIPYTVDIDYQARLILIDSYNSFYNLNIVNIDQIETDMLLEVDNLKLFDFYNYLYLADALPKCDKLTFLAPGGTTTYDEVFVVPSKFKSMIFDTSKKVYDANHSNSTNSVFMIDLDLSLMTETPNIVVCDGVTLQPYFSNVINGTDELNLSFKKSEHYKEGLTAEIHGKNGDYTSANGMSALSSKIKKLNISCDVSSKIIGGYGVTDNDKYGGIGANAIEVANVIINILSGNLTITGGNGGRGANGANASTSAYALPGYDGYNGGNSGSAIVCNSLEIIGDKTTNSEVILKSGYAGNGGRGGKGGTGAPGRDGEWFGETATEGGKGGTGGNGGLGGFAAEPIVVNLDFLISNVNVKIECTYDMPQGYAGEGGNGGPGGYTVFGNQKDSGPSGNYGTGTYSASSVASYLTYVYPDFTNTTVKGNYQLVKSSFDYSTW